MTNSDFLEEQKSFIEDIRDKAFVYTETTEVPHVDDDGLTYESGRDKKGKIIETCVLFVDIRNSVELVNNNQPDTMGKIYTAFTKTVLYAAARHDGSVRNIIGDRVMIVFPTENCFPIIPTRRA